MFLERKIFLFPLPATANTSWNCIRSEHLVHCPLNFERGKIAEVGTSENKIE